MENKVQGVESIRYFQIQNATVGTEIFAQLRDSSNFDNILWDARYQEQEWSIRMGETYTIDLSWIKDKLDGKTFIMAVDTFWGNDKYETRYPVVLDSNTTKVICGSAFGGARDGSLEFTGWRETYDPEILLVRPDGSAEGSAGPDR